MIAASIEHAGFEVTLTLDTVERSHRVRWTLPPDAEERDGHVSAGDAALAASLLPAMATGETLDVAVPVSPRLLAGVETIQDVFGTWAKHKARRRVIPPPLRRITVRASPRAPAAPADGAGVGAFFTGGVDSFYTALKRRDELTALVFVHGFDVPIGETRLRERIGDDLRKAAAALGLPLVEVESDVRGFSDGFVDWLDYHGSALASVALLLAPWLRRMYVPATMTYATLDPLGSHPLVDPLWSTDEVELVHDGCEATRLDKLRAIERSSVARTWLRVCPKNWDGTYNCGRCEKCLRTMVAVRLLRPAEGFSSLPELDAAGLHRVAHARIPGNGATWRLYLHEVEGLRDDPALARALRRAIRRRRVREAGASAARALRSPRRMGG